MNNNEITQRRDQAIQEANGVYNKIVQNQTDLINNQSKQIDDYLVNSESAINQSVNNNVSALQNAQETARRQQAETNQRLMNHYNNNYANNVDETSRIGALNAIRNRIGTEESSVSDMIQEYNNQIEQAKITGKSIIAQQALDMLKQKFDMYNKGMQNINDMLIGKDKNNQALTQMYGNLDNAYSNANNKKLDREEDARQFNQKLAYNNEQLKVQRNLKEQEYQLDLRDAKEAYYSRYSSGGSGRRGRSGGSSSGGYGGYGVSDGGNGASASVSSGVSGNTKLYANYTPTGLTKEGNSVYAGLTKQVLKNGYVTASQLKSAVSKLPKSQQSIIMSAFKQGSTKPATKVKAKTTSSKSSTAKKVVKTAKKVYKASQKANPVNRTVSTVNKIASKLFKKKK